MIPLAYVQAWSRLAPWPDLRQVEQDLVISRALCDLFASPALKDRIAFRGGTAINKLLFAQPLRYSEDIDLVQTKAEPIGETVDAVRRALAWLGRPKRQQAQHSMHLVYRFSPEVDGDQVLNLKVEINTREHTSLYGLQRRRFTVRSEWYEGEAEIVTFAPEELFGTKLRALLQRRKNRDLFDLRHGLNRLALDPGRVVAAFRHYLALDGTVITRAHAEQRMLEKLTRSLTEDVSPLLPAGVRFDEDDALGAFEGVWRELITRIDGEPWKLTDQAIEELRAG
ncbi:MAG: hypothetical protein RIS35_2163, partial [Pseudomonadota bacterium]